MLQPRESSIASSTVAAVGRSHHRELRRFGEFGLQAQGAAWIDSRHIESARRAMTHEMKRGGKVWIRIFPDKPVTAKPAETRMGSGKGAPDQLGRGRQAQPHHVRSRRCARRRRARGAAPRRAQAPACPRESWCAKKRWCSLAQAEAAETLRRLERRTTWTSRSTRPTGHVHSALPARQPAAAKTTASCATHAGASPACAPSSASVNSPCARGEE